MAGRTDDKKLRLRRERLRQLGCDLDQGALGQVAGGNSDHCGAPAGQVVSRCCS